jgi:hypothetical protein
MHKTLSPVSLRICYRKKFMRFISIILIFSVFESCLSSARKDIEREHPTWTSPDGKALIFQYNMNTHNTPIISLGTLIEKNFTYGGSSFFDMQNYKYDTVNVIWTSDSSALIEYPSTASVMRKDSKTFFLGRTTYLKYKAVKD